MQFVSRASTLKGAVDVPSSKSHTIRAVLLASLAEGESVLHQPLMSGDTAAAVDVYQALGARSELNEGLWRIQGVGGQPQAPAQTLDVRNSGTTMRVAMGSCTLLASGTATLTGDEQIQKRPCGPLVKALNDLGAKVESGGNGCAPFTVRGRLQGGRASIEAETSQYLTSLLLCCPAAPRDTHLEVPLLHEKPYVQMTLDWLEFQGVRVEHEDLARFYIPGGQSFKPFERQIPADFSSATFFLAAGALGDNAVTCRGLNLEDSQSDKAVLDFLRQMGAEVTCDDNGITVRADQLAGVDLDLNDCPDALPMMAVMGCFASGTTRLLNVPHARLKETDRIAVMAAELGRLGGNVEELADGLVIHQSDLRGAAVDGHSDHRVVMALAVAGTQAAGDTTIDTAEAAGVTFPGFADCLRNLGGTIESSG